jgi:GSH-dependent disulfide-bond oxidoreductase
MIELYTWTTPNGLKPLILLEELGVPYEIHWVNIGNGGQHAADFLALNPNAKIPALRDGELHVFESGALLIHLAEKFDRFLPRTGQARIEALAWLFFQVGGVGPMFGQYGHFLRTSEPQPYALERYRNESERLLGVLDARLREVDYLAGEYSIADIATVGWVAGARDIMKLPVASFASVEKWLARIEARPAVKRAREKLPPR